MHVKYFKKVIFGSLMAMLILMLLMAMLPFAIASGDTMYARRLRVPVTIDGILSAGEWSDAPQYNMTGNQTGYIQAKHNNTHLFVLIDLPWDQTNATLYWHENVWLAFDMDHSGGTAPQWGDYLIHPSNEQIGMGWQGNGTDWSYTWLGYVSATAQTGDMRNTTNAGPPNHRIVEMAVSLNYVGSLGSTVGFYAQADDDSSDPDGYGWQPAMNYSEWPSNSGGSPGWPNGWGSTPTPAPNAFGNLVLDTSVGGISIPVDKLALLAPYIGLTLTIIAAIAVTATFFKHKKKQ